MIFSEFADYANSISIAYLQKALINYGVVINEKIIKSIIYLLGCDHDVSKQKFSYFMYICENCDCTDVASILFFAADLDRSRTIEENELLYIFEQLNIQCNNVPELVRIASDQTGISYEMFYTIIQCALRGI